MTLEPFDLAQLLSPLTIDDFFKRYWERQHVHVHGREADYYRSLIDVTDLENVISQSDARYPAVRLAKGGHYFAPELYTRNVKHGDESFTGVPDVERISEEYRQGATIALPALHRTWPALGVLCENLQAQMDFPAHANVYITPGNARGFTPHYDVHEVFVLQIAGKKRWQLYEPAVRLPHRTQLFSPVGYAPQAPMASVELQAGDLLYLPRGVLHSTTTADSFSAHVTIGITVYTEVDLVKEFLATAIDDAQLREALPPGFASRHDLKPVLVQRLASALDKIRSNADLDRLVDSFTTRARAAHVRRPAPFRADVSVIDLDSVLQMPLPATYQITSEKEKTMLAFKGVRYQLLPAVVSTLLAMKNVGSFRPSELPGDLDRDAKLGLCRHLYHLGFLTTVVTSQGRD